MNRTRLKYYLRALGIGIIVTALLMGYSQGQAQMTDEEILRRAAELELESQGGVLADLATASPVPGAAVEPTAEPAVSATPEPAIESTASPTPEPTAEPAASVTPKPTTEPGASATPKPTASATPKPTAEPGASATPKPTASATPKPTTEPTASATPKPTAEPGASASPKPTAEPGASASPKPTAEPGASASPRPTAEPIVSPSQAEDVVVLVISRGESSVTVSKNLQELGLVEDYWVFDRFLCDNGYDHSIITGTHEIPLGATHEEIARIICKLR